MNRKSTKHIRLFLFASMFVVLGLVLFGYTGGDDTYISYWPAYTLRRFGSILNYNGVRMEQSSSLLLVLLVAATSLLGVKITIAGPLVSLFAVIGSSVCASYLGTRLLLRNRFLTIAIIGTFPYFVFWSNSGMESTLTSLCAALVILSCGAFLKHNNPTRITFIWPTITMLLLAWVRPEMPIALL